MDNKELHFYVLKIRSSGSNIHFLRINIFKDRKI